MKFMCNCKNLLLVFSRPPEKQIQKVVEDDKEALSLCGPLSEFRSLALAFMVHKMFPLGFLMSCCFPTHSILQMRKLSDSGALSTVL